MKPSKPDSDAWFSEEVQAHAADLQAWLRRRYPALTDPENLTQESLARVWRVREARGQIAAPRALLFTTARNLALDELRRRQIAIFEPIAEMGEMLVYEDGPTAADTAAINQELELLTQAIQSLPERCRQVLTLRKIYGMPQKEIAVHLGIAEHTVEVQVANGMRRCAVYLAKHGLP
ncbi:MAG: RNA polymerase sigma factor [Puniceicoccaceae bacterium]|nr:MAG: RNA polymerase sigma factor [Puniceicoccaceae bacterium]